MTDDVILVDVNDNVIGSMQKMEAHQLGKLHRAFSIFIFNHEGQLLLQQRALDKYHSGGKWTNTCCSHPRIGEETVNAAHRRLMEEMAMECRLDHVFSFTYKALVDKTLLENEYDHVFFGISDTGPVPNSEEVANYTYVNMNELMIDLKENPDKYTEWLKICFDKVMDHYHQIFN